MSIAGSDIRMSKEHKTLYHRLLDRGVPETEIDRVYRSLRKKGYGQDAAVRRMDEAIKKMNPPGSPNSGVILRERPPTIEEVEQALPETLFTGDGSGHSSQEGARKRAARPAAALRRKLNAWSFRQGLLITGLPQRWHDFLSLFRPSMPDLVHPRLIRELTTPHGLAQVSVHEFSLVDTLAALRRSSRHLLGDLSKSGHETVIQAYRRRNPFALEYLSRFSDPQKRLHASIASLEAGLLEGRIPEARELIRLTRELYRLVLTTDEVARRTVAEILAVGSDIVSTYARPASARDLETSRNLFFGALEQLSRFKRELYPVALRAVGRFYELHDDSPEKRSLLLSFAGLTDADVLSVRAFAERETKVREQRLIEEKRRELDELELEKSAGFSRRFHGALSVLETLFPESGIDRIEQNRYLLPYFATRVFSRTLAFDEPGTDIEAIAAEDPMQPVMVLHRVIDNLITSIDEKNLEQLTLRAGTADLLAQIRSRWSAVYASIFNPYLRAVTAYSKGLRDREPYAKTFPDSVLARSLRDEVMEYRRLVFRDYHTSPPAAGGPEPPQSVAHAAVVHAAVEELHGLLSELGQDISQDLVKRDDPIGARIYQELERTPFVDFERHGSVSSTEMKPVTRQLKRYVESKYYSSIKEIPKLSQLFFFDAMRGLVDLYRYLLRDEQSFLRRRSADVVVSTESERTAWEKERTERSRDSVELLRARLAENEAASFLDELTGLKNKNYFLKQLPRQFAELKTKKRPLCFLMVDIDHFKWVNDTLGHQKGDDVLRESAAALLDSIRLGHDVGIRYGGEEIVLMVQAPLHNAVLLAERLRYAQQERVATADHWTAIREIADDRGEPCGTFSIGVVQADGSDSVEAAMAMADRALYAAKQTRNAVVLTDPADSGAEPAMLRYEAYADRLRQLGSSR
ncbi:MAG: GGDEF domain-containing protein [Spirochaetaceae bacterium]|nr:MAG: GGDEF domain-containing protein [Spirochaetaceae bacterium]